MIEMRRSIAKRLKDLSDIVQNNEALSFVGICFAPPREHWTLDFRSTISPGRTNSELTPHGAPILLSTSLAWRMWAYAI
jgi:hypothetical protein